MIFSDCIGNKTAQAVLTRMLENRTLPHALLFCGPKGVGKGFHALRVAEKLMGSSAKVASGNHPDLHQLYPEGKSDMHPIENIRSMIKDAAYPPFEAINKVFIIHDAHQMLPSSSNALLKTLEEPIDHTYFILITSQSESLLPTIISRMRTISFFPIPDKDIEHYAEKHWHKDKKEAKAIGFLSHGSLTKARQIAHLPSNEMRTLVHGLVSLSLPEEHARLLSLCEACEHLLIPDASAADESSAYTVDDFLEEIFAWYRDLHLLKNNIAPEHLYHLDAIHVLQKKATMPMPSLEHILDRLLILRSSLHRHVKLRVALEHFFLVS